ncbi:MAG: type III secretion system inner rod subunit SctI [Victivallales bacterium]|nr:type III secretion system inner rod subunit SctI [Victivallales bacterium]
MTDGMIVEAIRSVRMSPADQAVALNANAPNVPAPGAVERFQAAMATNEPQATQKVASVPFAAEMSDSWKQVQEERQGILQRLRDFSLLNGYDGANAAAMLEMQYEIVNLSFQQEVVAKVADKSSNAVQTLIKNQ